MDSMQELAIMTDSHQESRTTKRPIDGKDSERSAHKRWKRDNTLRGGAVEWEPEQSKNQELTVEQQAEDFLNTLPTQWLMTQNRVAMSASHKDQEPAHSPENNQSEPVDSITHTYQPAELRSFEKAQALADRTRHERDETFTDRGPEFPTDTEDRQTSVTWPAERSTQLDQQRSDIHMQDSRLATEEEQRQLTTMWKAEQAEKHHRHLKMMEEHYQVAAAHKKMVEEYRKMGEDLEKQHEEYRKMCEDYQATISDQDQKISVHRLKMSQHEKKISAMDKKVSESASVLEAQDKPAHMDRTFQLR